MNKYKKRIERAQSFEDLTEIKYEIETSCLDDKGKDRLLYQINGKFYEIEHMSLIRREFPYFN